MRPEFGDDPFDLGRVEREIGRPLALDDRRPRDPGDLGVHLIRRLEGRDGATRAGIREQDRLEDLVRTVRHEDLRRIDAVQLGDRLAQLRCGTIGISVPLDTRHLGCDGVTKRDGGRFR